MTVRLETIVKIFGPRPEDAATRLSDGATKESLLTETGHTLALNNVSLTIPDAQTTVVMGLSGSGKSTLLRIVNRLIEPTSGQVFVDDVDLGALDEKALIALRRSRMAMVFQHFALLPHRSVIDNIAYGLEIGGLKKPERHDKAGHWLETVGLDGYADALPRELSGGMRQRVGLARGLATDADILLMDEPFSALDPLIRRDMQDLLLDLQKRLKKTIVFITHDLDEALRLGDQIAIMKDGEIVQNGSPRDILFHPESDYVSAFSRDANRARILKVRDVMSPPPVTVRDTDRPFFALRQCRDADVEYAFVVDSRDRPRGILTGQSARAGATTGGADQTVARFMQGVQIVPPDTPLDHALKVLLDAQYPLGVAEMGLSGPQGPLLGILTREAALGAVAGEDPATDQ